MKVPPLPILPLWKPKTQTPILAHLTTQSLEPQPPIRGKPKSSKSVSQWQKVGLQFPMGRIARFLKAGKYAERVSADVPVNLSAMLEYLAAEVGLWFLDLILLGLCGKWSE